MNAKLKVRVSHHEAAVGRSFNRVLSAKGHDVSSALGGEEALHSNENASANAGSFGRKRSVAANIGMFLASPFIGLAYVIALPLVGFYQIARLAHEAWRKNHPAGASRYAGLWRALKNIGLFFAAPFIALAYIIALPFVGVAMVARLAGEAHAKHRSSHC
jgi:hypothetical protein